jgi:Concanavalin A-like lectin/glucanases superfamily
MSASLVVLLPFILFGIVSLLCFVGCVLNTHGLAPTFTQYSTSTVLGNPAVVAYWPLNEANDTLPAADLAPNADNGQYIDQTTLPAIYPWPAFNINNSPSPDIISAAAPGTISFAQPGIVAGDFGINNDDSNSSGATGCLVVNGCYVNVPLVAKISSLTSFTLEAWVRVDWDKNAPHAWRAVLDARDFDPCTGFAIIAKADDNAPGIYHWLAVIGNGGTGAAGFTAATGADPIPLKDPSMPAGSSVYLAVTYDGPSQQLILYVNGLQSGPTITSAVYVPNTTKPLWIGAGVPYVPMRPQAAGVLAGPLFPFVGALQDVAIYSKALASDVILTHLHNGSGFNP